MRVLILSVTAGGGHLSAAEAISEALRGQGADTLVLDIYEYINKLVKGAIDKGYDLSTKHAPLAYRALYHVIENRHKRSWMVDLDPVGIANALAALRFKGFTDAFEPDCIVCTHPLAAQVANELRRRGQITAMVIGVNTDFTILPYWEDCTSIDHIVIANEMMAQRAQRRGIAASRLLPFGIPIKGRFGQSVSRHEARTLLGLPPAVPAVLMMGGSMGHGNMAQMADNLLGVDMPLEVVVVCGNNRQALRALEEKRESDPRGGRLHAIGFSDQVALLMDAVDFIVTKPGGLTVSESLAKRLPMILTSPIPGQEVRNTEFLVNIGAAIKVTKTLPIDEAVFFLFDHPDRRRLMQESIDMIRKPDAAKDLSEFIVG
jgi:processive 1,2-diacylglycerol beta-glucosyltransferase